LKEKWIEARPQNGQKMLVDDQQDSESFPLKPFKYGIGLRTRTGALWEIISDKKIKHMFNIRVYGILLGGGKQVLVSDEFIRGNYYTKFPGGGLDFGEGTRDCLKREFKEEMDLEVLVTDHLYTTDFFQMSAFNPEHQIISIYYFVEALEPIKAPLREKPFDFDERELEVYRQRGETETFRYLEWDDFSEASVTLPIDKVVAKLLKQAF
jgi:8-oxo-dGTP diphosphatase